MLKDKVKLTIEEYAMLKPFDKVLVGMSGGYDSTCLCLVLKELGYEVAIAYLNHSIREEADKEAQILSEFGKTHGFTFHTKKVDVPNLAKAMGCGLENAGRHVRYDFFDALCREFGYSKVAVAHNQNDLAETILLNLTRGSGINGLKGIPPVREKIIRPLIRCNRAEIEEFVDEKGIHPLTDESNFQNEYSRNRIRNLVIPELMKINPGFMDSIERISKLATEDCEYFENIAKEYVVTENGVVTIERNALLQLPKNVATRVLMLAYETASGSGKDFEYRHAVKILEELAKKEHGKVLDLCSEVSCSLEYGKLKFTKRQKTEGFCYPLVIGGETIVEEADLRLISEILPVDKCKKKGKNEVLFDYDEIEGEILVRSRQGGDRFVPFGMTGEKKLKDFFIDEKIPVSFRDKIPLVTADKILWVAGYRRSADYPVNKDTKNILVIRMEKRGKE